MRPPETRQVPSRLPFCGAPSFHPLRPPRIACLSTDPPERHRCPGFSPVPSGPASLRVLDDSPSASDPWGWVIFLDLPERRAHVCTPSAARRLRVEETLPPVFIQGGRRCRIPCPAFSCSPAPSWRRAPARTTTPRGCGRSRAGTARTWCRRCSAGGTCARRRSPAHPPPRPRRRTCRRRSSAGRGCTCGWRRAAHFTTRPRPSSART